MIDMAEQIESLQSYATPRPIALAKQAAAAMTEHGLKIDRAVPLLEGGVVLYIFWKKIIDGVSRVFHASIVADDEEDSLSGSITCATVEGYDIYFDKIDADSFAENIISSMDG